MNTANFQSEHLSREAAFLVNAPLEVSFPLFTPLEEKKWAHGWDPEVLYPNQEQPVEGMVFRTPGSFPEEAAYHWILSKYLPANQQVEYIVSTQNRYWVIKVKCEAVDSHHTKATVSYTYTGFNELGNQLNQKALDKMFENNLEDWAAAINHYVKTGELLQ